MAGLAFDEDIAAGLYDDAVDGRQAEAGSLADLLGREEGFEDLALQVFFDAAPGIDDFDQHIVAGGREAWAWSCP